MNTEEILEKIRQTESPLKRQLLMVGLLSKLLEEQGKDVPTVIGGCALSYYSREVYFTADIDLAYSDRESLDGVLKDVGFIKRGRYWVSEDLKMAIEVPASMLVGEDSPVEIVELGDELRCRIIGVEDLIIDRLNACKHWKSEIDCEMVELMIVRYGKELDWQYLEKKAVLPENNVLAELLKVKNREEKR
ncbi:MAG: hypothetical protein AB1390_00015 [Nitrospirota bacterium]